MFVPLDDTDFLTVFKRHCQLLRRSTNVEVAHRGTECWVETDKANTGEVLATPVRDIKDGNGVIVRAEGVVQAVADNKVVVVRLVMRISSAK